MDNQILEYASRRFGAEENSGQAEVAAEETVQAETTQDGAEVAAVEAEVQTEGNPEVEAQAQGTEAEVETPEAHPEVDIWKTFEEKSGGLLKDEDSFSAALARLKEYDEVVKAKQELETNQFKPANDYIATLNKLTLEGASQDQIKSFIKLNEVGDLNSLDPVDAKVAKLVLIDGYKEDVARKKVAREFPISDLDDEDDEKSIMEDDLRVSAKKDLEALQSYRKELSTVENTDKIQEEQNRLTEIANKEAYAKELQATIPTLSQNFPSKFTLEAKIGDDNFEFSVDDKFKSEIPVMLKDYFESSGEKITSESVGVAYEAIYSEYLRRNQAEILNEYGKKLSSHLEEKFSNKYENRSGLPKSEQHVDIPAKGDQMTDFYKRMGAIR